MHVSHVTHTVTGRYTMRAKLFNSSVRSSTSQRINHRCLKLPVPADMGWSAREEASSAGDPCQIGQSQLRGQSSPSAMHASDSICSQPAKSSQKEGTALCFAWACACACVHQPALARSQRNTLHLQAQQGQYKGPHPVPGELEACFLLRLMITRATPKMPGAAPLHKFSIAVRHALQKRMNVP